MVVGPGGVMIDTNGLDGLAYDEDSSDDDGFEPLAALAQQPLAAHAATEAPAPASAETSTAGAAPAGANSAGEAAATSIPPATRAEGG